MTSCREHEADSHEGDRTDNRLLDVDWWEAALRGLIKVVLFARDVVSF